MFMRKFTDQTYALMRIMSGFLFLWHGVQKVFGWPPMPIKGEAPWHIIWIAGPLELFGGLLLIVGLFTRWTAFLCSGLMACAYWMAHGLKAFLPSQNGGELAVLYCFVFLYISARGAGIWSLDSKREGNSGKI
jgi:putative oxidoreductase